jgi:hypothetical protein
MSQRYVRRLSKNQAERYRELLRQEEPLIAEIAINQWALEQHLDSYTRTGEGDEAAMTRLSTLIGGHTEQIRKLEETRHKIEHDNRLSWTPRQVQTFIMRVAGIIDLYEKDTETRRQIAAALQALVENKKFLQWPDEDMAQEVVARVYDRAMLEG